MYFARPARYTVSCKNKEENAIWNEYSRYGCMFHSDTGMAHYRLQKKDDQKIEGALCLFQNETTFRGKLADDGEITFAGQMVTLTRTFLYQAYGRIDGTKIRLHVSGDRNTFSITGEEVTL